MTLRTWVLGLAWSVIIPGVNQFLFFRYPSVPVVGIVAQLISYPLGSLWASYMPRKRIFGVSLNPGPFSIKEHVLITVGVLFWTICFRPLPVIYTFVDHGHGWIAVGLCSKSMHVKECTLCIKLIPF
jgi:hypothetical protein